MRKSSKQVLGMLLAAVIAVSSFPLMGYAEELKTPDESDVTDVTTPSLGESGVLAAALSLTEHDLSTGPLTLTAAHGDVRVYGDYDALGNAITIRSGYSGVVTLDNVTIDANLIYHPAPYEAFPDTAKCSGIYMEHGATVTINVVGSNTVRGANSITSESTSHLVINGTGTLTLNPYDMMTNTAPPRGGYGPDDIDTMGITHEGNLTISAKTYINAWYCGISVSGSININSPLDIFVAGFGIFAGEDLNINGALNILASSGGIECRGTVSINATTTIKNSDKIDSLMPDGILAWRNLVINAPVTIESWRYGIMVTEVDIYAVATGSLPLEINADVTITAHNGFGVYSEKGIHLNRGHLSVNSINGFTSYPPHGIVWGTGYENAMTSEASVTSSGGTFNDGTTGKGYAYATFDNGVFYFAESFTESNAQPGGTSATVLPSAPATSPTIPTAVIPSDSLPSGLNHGDLAFQSNLLDSTAKDSLQQEIASDSGITSLLTDYPNWQNNAEWIDLSLVDTTNDNTEVQPSGPITIYLPFPAGRNASNSDFLLLHKASTGIEVVPFTLTQTGIKFTVSSLSPFVLLYKDKSGTGGGIPVYPPTGNTGGSSGSSGGSRSSGSSGGYQDGSGRKLSLEESFWSKVTQYIKFAKSGEVIDVLLPYYITEVPEDVLTTLAGKKVTLLLREARGNTEYTIYGGDIQKNRITEKAYPFTDLSRLMKSGEPSTDVSSIADLQNPQTGGDDGYIPIAQVVDNTPATSAPLMDTGNINGNPSTGGGMITLYSNSRTAATIPPADAGTSIISQEDKVAYIALICFFVLAFTLPLIEYSISESKKKKRR